MRLLPIAVVMFALTSLGCGDEKKRQSAGAGPTAKAAPRFDDDGDHSAASATLKVGDAAPTLVADDWLHGAPVKEFAQGKVYVVEFWATWCGPCIIMMPHVGDLQAEYRDQGVTVIGFSAKDPGENPRNNRQSVSEFVKQRGPKLGYTFAYADDQKTYAAWMTAAGQNGIPCCFVVDQAAKIAYIGHPMFLDLVLPKVVAGTWTNKDNEGLQEVKSELDGVFKTLGGRDAEAGLKALGGLEAKHPKLARLPFFIFPKLGMLLATKDDAGAKLYAAELMKTAIKKNDADALRTLSAALRSPEAKEQKELLDMALKAAEASLTMAGEKDATSLMAVAESHFALGDRAKAREIGARAVESATPRQRPGVEKRVKAYGEEK